MFVWVFSIQKGITQVSENRFELRATTVPVPSRAHETSWQKLPPAPGCGSPPTAVTAGGFKGLAQAEQPAAEKTIGGGGGGGGGEGGVAALASVPPWAYWSHCGGAASCPTYPRHEPTEGELAIFLMFYFFLLFSFHFILVLFHFMLVFSFSRIYFAAWVPMCAGEEKFLLFETRGAGFNNERMSLGNKKTPPLLCVSH
eukprot:COSAG06_NODE_8304_length_2206_cov_48.545066_2_plen_199_part_00